MTRNMIFTFIGGVVLGVSGTVAVMKRTGYVRLTPEQEEYLSTLEDVEREDSPSTPDIRDTSSFETKKEINTHAIRYDILEDKPDLDELASKYENEEEAAENEHPTEDDGSEDEEEEEEDDPDPSLAYVVHDDEDDEDHDCGHVVFKLPAKRKNELIFLVPQDYAGEVYLLEDLIYYEGDDVLTDVTDAPVDDPLAVIGDSLGYFGQHGADEDKLFVRNCTIGIEYEITRIHGRFADKLYGVNPEELDDEPKNGIRKMRKERDEE